MQRYTFQDTLIEHMAQANNGEAAATAEWIKHFSPLTDPNFAEIKILLRDALIMQVTGAEPMPKRDLDAALAGPP